MSKKKRPQQPRSTSNWMAGRYGIDELSNAVVTVAFVLVVASWIIPHTEIVSYIALALLAVSFFRILSRNIPQRAKENRIFLEKTRGPRQWLSQKNIEWGKKSHRTKDRWDQRKTTRFLKCKGCGQSLSVPRGKGTIRVVCPKCKTETTIKS